MIDEMIETRLTSGFYDMEIRKENVTRKCGRQLV